MQTFLGLRRMVALLTEEQAQKQVPNAWLLSWEAILLLTPHVIVWFSQYMLTSLAFEFKWAFTFVSHV